MKKTKEVFIDGEIVYLKKDFLGWHITYPVKIDGKIDYKNLIAGGSWLKLFLVILFVIIMIMAIFEYVNSLRFCADLIANQTSFQSPNFLNLSNFVK